MIRLLIASLILNSAAMAAASVLHRGNQAEPSTLDPQKFNLSIENVIMSEMFSGLLTLDAAGRNIPGLAESWTLSPDGKTYRFTLRPNLVWSDGVPITAEDAAYGLRRAVDPKTQGQFTSFLSMIENASAIAKGDMPPSKLGVAALDARTLEIRMNRPSPTLLFFLSGWPITYPVPKHIVEKNPTTWTRPGTIAVSGPYQLASWRLNDNVKLVKNPRFYDAANVKIEEVYFYPTVDDAASLNRFRAKELDMNTRFAASQIDWLRKNLPEETKVNPGMASTYLTINLKRKPFDDPRVRRALALSIDRTAITDKLLRNGERPACGIVPATIPGYKAPCQLDQRPMAERQKEAKALLAQAGYGPSKPLAFVYSVPSGQATRNIAVAISSMWAQIGVKAELLQAEAGVHFAKLAANDFDVAFAGFFANADPEFFTYLLKSTSTESNYGRYNNPAFDAAVNKAEATVETGARLAAFAQAEAIALKDDAVIPMYIPVVRLLIHKWVKGVVQNSDGGYPTRYISVQRPGSAAP
jgi:oligopeptide transport system substrate-binding protein